MDPCEHDRLLEALEETTASLRVTPQLPQRLRARGVGRLVVADTDVLAAWEHALFYVANYRFIGNVLI